MELARAVWKFWLFAAIFVPLMVGLGLWQLERAAYKGSLLEEREAQRNKPLLPLLQVASESVKNTVPTQRSERGELIGADTMAQAGLHDTLQPYAIAGGAFSERYFLLDNQTRAGQVGYDVLQPFQLASTEWILVNRGWLPAPRYRSQLPQIPRPEIGDLVGYFYAADGTLPQLGADSEHPQSLQQDWPQRIQAIDWNILQTAAGVSFARWQQFRLNAASPAALNTQWPVLAGSVAKHHGYAVQWFAMALALCVLTAWATLKARRELTERQLSDQALKEQRTAHEAEPFAAGPERSRPAEQIKP